MNKKVVYVLIVFIFCLSHQANSQVPPPSASRADRFGLYAWGFESTSFPSGESDRLNWAANKVAQIGSRTVRITLPGEVYGLPLYADLAQTAASSAYEKLFSDPRFQTYLVTLTTTGAFIDSDYLWSDGYTASEYAATRQEVGRLGDYLLGNPKFAGKTFILLNWESDNELGLYANKQSIWDAFTAWIQSRADGVKDARLRNPNSAARLYSGLEFLLVRAASGLPCGSPVVSRVPADRLKNRCAIDYVAPRVSVDYYSYSAWNTVNDAAYAQEDFKAALNRDLNFALAKVRAQRPEIQEQNFLIGEYGFHPTRWGEKTAARYVSELFDALEAPDAFEVSYVIYWQIIDNLPFNIVWEEGFGLFRARGGSFYLNFVGSTFQRKLNGQPPEAFSGGPLIRQSPPGIVNAVSGNPDFILSPSSSITLFANGSETPFSASNNRVTIEQMMNHFELSAGNTPGFSESSSQITTPLPNGLRPGRAFIQIVDANGVESKAQFVNFSCSLCPEIKGIIDSEKQISEFNPGTVITITGNNFSPNGNSVAVEQQDVLARKYRFVIPASDILQETPELLKVKLPLDLIKTKFTVVVVTNKNGNESNMFALRAYPYPGIVPGCPNCRPVISIQRGILNADGTDNLYISGQVMISGDRFSTTGNQVVVEQDQQRYVLERSAIWSESPSRIIVALSSALQPGNASLYVIDAQGRESLAQPIYLQRRQGPRRSQTTRDVIKQ